MKVLVYCDTVRQGRRAYPMRNGEFVGYRQASLFIETEEADKVIFAGDYPEIEAAYAKDV